MPKMKTHRGAAKRIKKTGTGKVKFFHAFKRHKLAGKSAKRKRKLRRSVILAPGDAKKYKTMLP